MLHKGQICAISWGKYYKDGQFFCKVGKVIRSWITIIAMLLQRETRLLQNGAGNLLESHYYKVGRYYKGNLITSGAIITKKGSAKLGSDVDASVA